MWKLQTSRPTSGRAVQEPKIKVTLSSDGDAYFGTGITKSDISVSGNDATVTSVSRSGKYELNVSLTLEKLERDSSDYDLDVTGLNWDDYDGTASWEEPEDAKRYEVRLYRDGSSVSSAISTTDTSYNFASYFTRSGDYTFKVRASTTPPTKVTGKSQTISVFLQRSKRYP